MRQTRLFIAINMPEKVKNSLGSFIRDLRSIPAEVKWVEESNIHLTLQFLGDVAVDRVPSIVGALQRSVFEKTPFSLVIKGTGVFPSASRPRVFWAGVSGETGSLLVLQRRVQVSLEPLGFPADKRGFFPHITLARIKSQLGFQELFEKGEKLAESYIQFGLVRVNWLELMSSKLHPQGPEYSVVARIPIPGP